MFKMKTHEPIPSDFPVQPLKSNQKAKDKATCGHCGLSWDDGIITSYTPAPSARSARCPFEAFHLYPQECPDNPNDGSVYTCHSLTCPIHGERNRGE
jgi:hypothetical protein